MAVNQVSASNNREQVAQHQPANAKPTHSAKQASQAPSRPPREIRSAADIRPSAPPARTPPQHQLPASTNSINVRA